MPTMSAALATKMIPEIARPQPPIHPMCGVKALVAQVNVVPQSGITRFNSR